MAYQTTLSDEDRAALRAGANGARPYTPAAGVAG
jgi:hypothetical protein